MANKRQIKKRIQYVCGQMAAELLLAQFIVSGIKDEDVNRIVCNIAALQSEAIGHVSVSFDKVPRDFAQPGEYARARRAYYRAAFARLKEDFATAATDIVKQMNEAVPEDQRKLIASLG